MVETEAAIGIAAAPGVVALVVAVFRPLITRWLPSDALPPIALALGVGYTMLAWYGGVIEAANIIVALLLGVTVGVGASGAREILKNYREDE